MSFFLDAKSALVEHLRTHALRTDGPYTLASGRTTDWYVDGRQTTFDGEGARRVAACVLDLLQPEVTALGGMTMGADPIAVATAVLAPRPMRAFSIRKEAKAHGMGGRLVGPVGPGDEVAVVDDTVTTGASTAEAVTVLRNAGIEVVQAVAVVDRSGGEATQRLAELGVAFRAIVTPEDLGVVA